MNPVVQKIVYDHLITETNQLLTPTSVDWKTTPVSLKDFVSQHLDLPPLSTRQYQDVISFLGEDPQQVFNHGTPYNTLCWLGGKGSGKDYVGAIVLCYVFYLLLCMRNPQGYFGMPATTTLDLFTVSFSKDQALDVSFNYIKGMFRRWYWLKANFTVIEGDRLVTSRGKPEILILNETITSPQSNLRVKCQHSANESYEGYNIIFWIMSEASAFTSHTKTRNGDKVYSTLKTSSSSRFLKRWKGMVMSFPRFTEDVDFTYLLYQDREKDPSILGTCGATWDFNPFKYKTSATFDHKGYQIPIDHKEDFEAEPEESERKYLCIPGKGGKQIFSEDIVIRGVTLGKQSLLEIQNEISPAGMVVATVHGLERKDLFRHNYLITIDLGQKVSAAALALQHIEEGIYVLDAIGAWTPDPLKGYIVDFIDVEKKLFEILEAIPRTKIAFDQWQSALLIRRLQEAKIPTATYHTYDSDYVVLQKGMAMGKIKLLDDERLITQLNALRERDGKVYLDKNKSPRMDLVTVVAGGFKMLFSERVPTDLPGTIITSNMSEFGVVLGG